MTITVVQSVTGTSAGSQTLNLTLGSSTAAGNCLVVCTAVNNVLATATVSTMTLGGAAGNFAKAISAGLAGGSAGDAEIWADPNCTGSQTGVAITSTGGTAGNTCLIGAAYEVSGLLTASPVDKTSPSTGSTGTAWSSGATATTTQAAEIWFGCFAGGDASSGATITGPASPWTNTSSLSNTVSFLNGYFMSGYQIVSSTGACTYAGSHDDSGNMAWGAVAVTLKASAAGSVKSGLFMSFFA